MDQLTGTGSRGRQFPDRKPYQFEGADRVSRKAVEYVLGLQIADLDAKRVFMVLAGLTESSRLGEDPPQVMGLNLPDKDIPALAARAGMEPQEFRRLLRVLKSTVAMDVLEHADSWEIVYGPAYTGTAPAAPPAPAVAARTPSVPAPAAAPGRRAAPSVSRPRYWLIHALPWPTEGGPVRECALAYAPPLVPRQMIEPDAAKVLRVADAYQQQTGLQIVFFSDLTRWLDQQGRGWVDVDGADWERGLEQLQKAPALSMYLGLSQFHHVLLADASRKSLVIYGMEDKPYEVTDQDRRQLRDFIHGTLTRDWPPYVQGLIDAGKLHTR